MTSQAMGISAVRSAPASQVAKGEPRVRVRGLGKRYGTLEVFRNIDFDVGEREIVAIVGPPGLRQDHAPTLHRRVIAARCR